MRNRTAASLFPVALLLGVALPAAAQRPDARFELSVETEALSPDGLDGDLHRLRASAAVAFSRFRVFGTLGTAALAHARGPSMRGQYVISGIDTVLSVASMIDPADTIEVAFPEYARWQREDDPFDQRGRGSGLFRFSYADEVWAASLTYGGGRTRRVFRSIENRFNPQAWRAEHAQEDRFRVTISGQPGPLSRLGVTLYADASRGAKQLESGIPTTGWLAGELDPGHGFGFGSVEFQTPPLSAEYDDAIARGLRSAILPAEAMFVLPGASDLIARQSIQGIFTNLRMNPYGVAAGLPIAGAGRAGETGYSTERVRDSRLRLSSDWITTLSWLTVGLDWTGYTIEEMHFPLIDSGDALMRRTEPSRWGFDAADRLALGPVFLEAGLRFDRIDMDGEHPRVPGYTTTIPDSLRGDAYELDPLTGPEDTRTLEERIRPVDCRGAPVCHDNFIATEPQNGWSPRGAIGVRLPQGGTLRASYSVHRHGPGERATSPYQAGAERWTEVILLNAYGDVGGWTPAYAPHGRDVRMPRTALMKAGYAHELRDRVALELSVFRQTVEDALTFRFEPYISPVTGRSENMLVLTNRDRGPRHGVDATGTFRPWRLGEVSVTYAYREVDPVDALLPGGLPAALPRGPSIDFDDPWSNGFGASSNALLDQHRRHTISAGLSLLTAPGSGLLDDVGARAVLRVASGLDYRPALEDDLIGPPAMGSPVSLDDESLPWLTWVELRVQKGLPLAGGRLRVFAHLAGPLRAAPHQVFLATGETENPQHREQVLSQLMTDWRLDGDTNVDGFWVADCIDARALCEVPEGQTIVNAYALREAEARFGDGDGFFDIPEQRAAFGAYYAMFNGPQWLERSDRSLRIGIELVH